MKAGINSYGIYIPKQVVDEDVFTISCRSAERCISSIPGDRASIGAIYLGSETRPYAVKSVACMVAGALKLESDIFAADVEFACKSGTSAMQIVCAMVESGRIYSGMAIGSDIPLVRSDDPLHDSTGPGSVSFLISNSDYFAEILDFTSVAADIADFWRGPESDYPSHAGRFTGEGSYMSLIPRVVQRLLKKTGLKNSDIHHLAMHMPNEKYPYIILERLGMDVSVIRHSFIFPKFKNTFSSSCLLGLCGILEKAAPSQNILLVGFGSGAGADALLIRTNDAICDFQKINAKLIWSS